jgi:hypothetical protein
MPYPFVAMKLAHFSQQAGFVTTPPTPFSRQPAFKNNAFKKTLGEPLK